MFEYLSPVVKDDDDDKVTIFGISLDEIPCKCLTIEQTPENTFKLQLVKPKLTRADIGKYNIGAALSDGKMLSPKEVFFEMSITYEELKVVKQKIQTENGEEKEVIS